jgi:hypothetical protein
MKCAGIGVNKQKQPIKKLMNMTNENQVPELRYTVKVWTETQVFERLKNHSKKVPLYRAEVKELEFDEDSPEMVKISIQLRAKGRNQFYQNLTLFLINSLK